MAGSLAGFHTEANEAVKPTPTPQINSPANPSHPNHQRLRIRREFVGDDEENGEEPDMGWFSFFQRKRATPIDSAPAVFGGILVWSFCFEPHFGLSNADLRALAAPLLETIRGPANFWTVVYLCWVYRTGLRAKYGDDFFEAAFQSAYARLARSDETATYGDDLRFWFTTLDKAGDLVQAPEIPMEYFAALAFLGLSPDSPFFGRSDFVGQGIELELAEVLKKAKTSALQQIEMLVHGSQDDPAFASQWRKLCHSFESEGSQLLK